MNKDQKEGAVSNIKGRARQAAGIVTGDKDAESKGAAERTEGAIQKAIGDLKHRAAKKLDK
jgi:uncharacterized protein YjbJ (UPF0337 family)